MPVRYLFKGKFEWFLLAVFGGWQDFSFLDRNKEGFIRNPIIYELELNFVLTDLCAEEVWKI